MLLKQLFNRSICKHNYITMLLNKVLTIDISC
jgi:hypothetical protein